MKFEGQSADGRRMRVTVRDGRFDEVLSSDEPDVDDQGLGSIDRPILLPGLIDMQVNGYAGHDINDADPAADTVIAVGSALTAQGVTGWCPTVITGTPEAMLARLRAIAQANRRMPADAARILGIHVEGPFLAADEGPRGAHPAEHLRQPDLAELRRWQQASGGLVRVVTLAPELPGAVEFIEAAVAQEIVVAVGHTAATAEQIHAAAAAGARMSTHLGNGAHAMLPRHPNYLWAQAADDRLTAGFIADGHHLPVDTFKVLLRAKGVDRAVLVSDVAALAGLPPGRYRTPVGGDVEILADGRLAMPGSGLLAGSGAVLADCLRWTVRTAGIPLPDATRMATENPARLLAVPGGRRIEPGHPADLTVLDGESLSVVGTLCAGQWIAKR